MKLSEWLATLKPDRHQSTGEDIADSIALAVIVALLMTVVFL